ncbi:uncharacterized protein LOC129573497 [Sitodiplosis mosellana]|uniref:uncharacterized protein LOC129573497 n=1 Tax=Sitodiplosis mosellana TaxID=263140 RepID=UPI002444AE61|nr:uncharacterized protein LOC129573497 [Sitodiplosis mosellana]
MNLLHGLFSVLFIVEFSELHGKHGFFSQALLKGEVIENMSQAKFVAGIHVPAKYLYAYKDNVTDADREMLSTCTAFILSKTEIITNAHCVAGAPYVYVVAGTKVALDEKQKNLIKVEKENLAYHPLYNESIVGAFDIAKITLEKPLEFSETVGSIKLVDKDYKLNNSSEMVTVYGYGVLNLPMILRRCDANYISDVKRANTFNPVQTLYFTTGDTTKDGEIITAGDSGGPVVSKTNGKIVGITVGINGTTSGRGMFLPITLFLDFIHDPKSVKPIPPPLTPNEAKFMADITVQPKFLTSYKDSYADADENFQLQFNAIILSETKILTCAHQVHGAPYVYIIVNKLSSNPTKIKVTEDQIEIHQKYTLSGFAFDIAKITLKEPLEFNDNVGSIDLVDKDYKLNDPSEMVTVYGDMVLHGTMRMRRYDIKYLNGTKCKPKLGDLFDANHLMCYTFDESNGNPCAFGGPMISKKNNKLVGMTIIGLPDEPVIFQPIVPLLDWIRKPRSVTPNEAKFLVDIWVPGKFLTATKEAYANAEEDDQIQFNAIILSKTEILTCAHNVHGAPYVYVIVNKLSSNPTKIKVTEDQIEIHEKYASSRLTFDIAKITLEEPLEFNDNVGSIDLVDKDYKLNDPSEVVTAYGDVVFDGTIQTRRYDTKYLDGVKCKPQLGDLFDANHLMCYTLDEIMGTPSTFGGPMISKKNNKLVGMTIIRLPDQPVIFQPIAPLRDWIRKRR